MATQFDIIRNQAEAAARNAVARVQGGLRRDASLVNQASRWAGRTLTQGEAAVRARAGEGRRRSSAARETTATQAHPVRPAPDGYVRRSPVQHLHVAADYRRRLVARAVTAAVNQAPSGSAVFCSITSWPRASASAR